MRLLLAAFAALMITSAHAQDPIETLLGSIAQTNGIVGAGMIACGIAQPVNYSGKLITILSKTKPDLIPSAIRRVRAAEEAERARIKSCDSTTNALIRTNLAELNSNLDELERRLAR